MAPSNEEKVIQQKLKELAALVEQREQIQAKITKTEAAIRAFIALLEDELDQEIYAMRLQVESKPLGLTESVKRVVREAGKFVDAAEVRNALTDSGFPLSGYANPLAVIHTTLNRLHKQGLVDKNEEGDFQWKSEKKNHLLELMQQRGFQNSPLIPIITKAMKNAKK
jgi:hypothetical protein